MAQFVFVHGAWHSAWCWGPVIDALADRGVEGIAVDLPTEDPEAGLAEYAAAVVAAVDGLDGDVVVVGHSLGGMTLPLVASQRHVVGLVYVAALTTEPTQTAGDMIDDRTFGANWADYSAAQVTNADGSSSWPREAALDVFYHDCIPALADVAVTHLRAQHWKPIRELSPLSARPDVPTRYVVCEQDRVLSPTWQRDVAAPRVGATIVALDCGHSPMLAKPRALVDLLLAPFS